MAKEEEEREMRVEYVEPTMASHLLYKYPDTSAFDFDYSQSRLWSPLLLLPPPHNLPPNSAKNKIKNKKKKIREDLCNSLQNRLGKIKNKIKKKKKKKTVYRKLDFVAPSPSPAPEKAWSKVFKATLGCMTRGRMKAIRLKDY
ncbi:uncharacterized protein LOC144704902 [Wolffia australiana]